MSLVKGNNLVFLFLILLSISQLLLVGENTLRATVVLFLIIIWIVIYRKSRSTIYTSLLLLIFVIPFNITIAFPDLQDTYVRGVYSNYLTPTLSIIDIFVTLLLLSLLSTVKKVSIPKWVYIPLGYALLHIMVNWGNIVVPVSILRVLLYTITGISILSMAKDIFKNHSDALLRVVLLSVGIQVIISLLQIKMGTDLGLQFIGESNLLAGTLGTSFIAMDSGQVLRGYGTFPHPNILSACLLLSTIITLYMKDHDRLRLLVVIVSSIGVLITFSRTALLLLLLIFVIYGISLSRKRLYSILPITFVDRIFSMFTGTDTSVKDRIALISHSLSVIKDNYITGVGSGNYVSTMREMYVTTEKGFLLLQPVHNIFLLILAEHGIAGIFIILGILFKLVLYNLRRGNIYFYVSILAFVILFGLSDHFFLTLPQGLALFLIALFL